MPVRHILFDGEERHRLVFQADDLSNPELAIPQKNQGSYLLHSAHTHHLAKRV